MVDQAEYLLQHPDCVPAQIIQTLLELQNQGTVLMHPAKLPVSFPQSYSVFPPLALPLKAISHKQSARSNSQPNDPFWTVPDIPRSLKTRSRHV